MLTRLAQIAVVLVASGTIYSMLVVAGLPPRPTLIAVSIVAGVLCLNILIRPMTLDGWHSFWEAIAGIFRWW